MQTRSSKSASKRSASDPATGDPVQDPENPINTDIRPARKSARVTEALKKQPRVSWPIDTDHWQGNYKYLPLNHGKSTIRSIAKM